MKFLVLSMISLTSCFFVLILIIKAHLITDVAAISIRAADLNELSNSTNESTDYSESTFNYNYVDNAEENTKSLNSHDTQVLNVNEYVAKVKGGIREARKLAKRLNLKLIKRVI
jgi:hypothetical protein